MSVIDKISEIKFNHFWKFLKQPLDTSIEQILAKENEFIDVTLPHDWLIYDVNNLYETTSGWYIKEFNVDLENEFNYSLKFEGVYMDSSIYINNILVGTWKYGYTSFEFEITKYLKDGKNKVIVQVKHEHPNSRWYSGAGIYRNVWFIKKHNKRIEPNGVYVKTNYQEKSILIDTKLSHKNGKVRNDLFYDGKLVATQTTKYDEYNNKQLLKLKEIFLWTPDYPLLYELETVLIIDGIEYDKKIQKIGFKDIVMDSQKGLLINGEKEKLRGVCEHHDFGSLGSAFSKELQKNRFRLLKRMGVNAIRTAHYVPSIDFMNLADEMGFLIVSDAFDTWEKPKNKYDYSRFFKKYKELDVKSWITRDRNHVSLLMWSIGNEIYDTHVDEEGIRITKELVQLVRKYDYMENAPITIGSNFMMGENAQKCTDILKYAGYNYAENLYNEQHQKYPDWKIYGSETASIVQSRGIYHFPIESKILVDDDKQCSSLGNSTTSWGANKIEDVLTYDDSLDYSLGQFIWTGFDYLGEPTPYDTKNSYFGQIDTAGFPKDSFYVYKSKWNSEPMIHIYPYWKFNKGQLIDVRVATNQHSVKLFLNKKFIGEKYTNDEIIPTFKVPYEDGEILAITYDENGKEIISDKRVSFGEPSKLRVTTSKNIINADGEDITEITIEVEDEKGNLVYDANNGITIDINGPGKILGIDNGDSTNYEQFKTNHKKMFSGKLKVFIGSTLESGIINIIISSNGFESENIEIITKEKELNGESLFAKQINHNVRSTEMFHYKNEKSFVPIRRIELNNDSRRVLNLDQKETIIDYNIYPSNATNKDLIWKVVNEKGVETNIAKLVIENEVVKVVALGDGNFTVRAMTNNDKKHVDIISELSFKVEGLGTANKDPYNFISASLYDSYIGEIKAGNEKGIATSNNSKTMLIFNNVDFGNIGSNQIELPIFSFDSKPLEIKLYSFENEKRELIGTFEYFKNTIWDVYQSEKYYLKNTLKGINNLGIEFSRSVHFKGFKFYKYDKTYEQISILDSDVHYGDSYINEKWGISNIGNNVSFTFNEFNFNEGISSIIICGKANESNNTIRIQSIDQKGKKYLKNIEYEVTTDFVEKKFDLDNIFGLTTIEFIFLPGSNFDFKWFKFIKYDDNKGE